MTFSDSMRKIESLCKVLEEESLPLEKALECYEEGMRLLKECKNHLTEVDQKVMLINENLEMIPYNPLVSSKAEEGQESEV